MLKIGEYIVYKRDVCKIKEIKENYFKNQDYYILEPIQDKSLKISVPIQNEEELKPVISKEKVQELINKIPNINVIEKNDKILENEYKLLLNNGTYEDLIKIIKTTYMRNQKRKEDKKKVSEKDLYYFNLAEKYLYTECSVSLNLSYDDTKNYIIKNIQKM
jgi:CarD family transcriptional regulator